ncbi:MAG TPA: protein kinase [Polyangiaceae bacterium]|jgi:serine/threonine-protein kinase
MPLPVPEADPNSLALLPTRAFEPDSGSITAPGREVDPLSELEFDLAVDPQPGDRIGEHYRIVRSIGNGAMGLVLLANDELLERFVAIKLIRSHLLSKTFRERFVLEARAMAKVNHPNVLPVYAFGEHRGMPYFVMEYVPGPTLYQWRVEHGLPDIDVVLRILDEVCEGVSAIHAAGAIHRDIKPTNLLLDQRLHARVADLGLAQPMYAGSAKETVGTAGYLAPEIIRDDDLRAPASERSDVYSLACVAYELLVGQSPFFADEDCDLMEMHVRRPIPRPSDVRPELPRAFDDVLLRALAKNPFERTASVELFQKGLHLAREAALTPRRILVAEDNADFRELLALGLGREFPSAEIECVSDGRALIDAFDRAPASLVLVDFQMPVIDGLTATAMLRLRPQSESVPIIVLTGSGGPQDWALLKSLGADRFIIKPIHLDDMLDTIRHVLRERTALRSEP